MTVTNKSGVKRYALSTPNRRHISKAAARGHKKGVVEQCFADAKVRSYTIRKVARIIQSELKTMCSSRVGSVLKTRKPRSNRTGLVGMCVAMLLKHRFHRMSLVHKIMGLILYAGHSGKQVSAC